MKSAATVGMKLASLCLAFWLSAAAGCSGAAVTTDQGSPGPTNTGGGAQSSPTECDALAAALVHETPASGACTALVRLDFNSLEILGHTFVCGPYATTDIDSARAVSDAALSGSPSAGPDPSVSGQAPVDEFVFESTIGDLGHASGVSAQSGLLLFTARLDSYPLMKAPIDVGSPSGDFDATKPWSTTDLGSDCTTATMPPWRGVDLRATGTTAPQFEQAANVVLASALPESFARWGSLQDVLVVAFPGQGPTAGPRASGPPSSAEYIVLLNGGSPR